MKMIIVYQQESKGHSFIIKIYFLFFSVYWVRRLLIREVYLLFFQFVSFSDHDNFHNKLAHSEETETKLVILILLRRSY